MKKIIPFGDRLLVKRRPIGEKIGKAGIIVTADETKERPTDLADVIYTAELSMADKQLIDNAAEIIQGQTDKAKSGDADALVALLKFNEFLKIKSIKAGDAVMVGKYVGIDFHDNAGSGSLTLVNGDDIIALIAEA